MPDSRSILQTLEDYVVTINPIGTIDEVIDVAKHFTGFVQSLPEWKGILVTFEFAELDRQGTDVGSRHAFTDVRDGLLCRL